MDNMSDVMVLAIPAKEVLSTLYAICNATLNCF